MLAVMALAQNDGEFLSDRPDSPLTSLLLSTTYVGTKKSGIGGGVTSRRRDSYRRKSGVPLQNTALRPHTLVRGIEI